MSDTELNALLPESRPRRKRTFLGRLSGALRRQDWFAIALEVLIVVLGVVIGFQVNAWGNERSSRTQERELLRGLRAELTDNIDLIDRVTEEHRESIRQARRVLAWTGPDPGDVSPAVMDTLVTYLISEMPAYHPAMGEVEAMMGAGQLGLVRNDSLRTLLATWPNVLERYQAVEDEMRADVSDRFFPYVLERVPLVSADRQVGCIETDRPSRFPQRYDALLADMVFENHVENRWVLANEIVGESESVRDLLVRMVETIDAELESSGVVP